MIVSAYTVETNPRGFAPCIWHATSRKQAETMARSLSDKHADSDKYPNPFWVVGEKSICKYWHGTRYEAGQPI